jgi:hypothetical protein
MDDKTNESAFYEMVGRFAVAWDLVEAGVDYATVGLFDIDGQKFEKRMPRVLSCKISFIERCLTELPKLAGIKAQGLAVMSDVTALSDTRHDLIHGVITSRPEDIAEKVSMVRLMAEKTHYLMKRVEVTPAGIQKAIEDADALGNRTLDLAKRILDISES